MVSDSRDDITEPGLRVDGDRLVRRIAIDPAIGGATEAGDLGERLPPQPAREIELLSVLAIGMDADVTRALRAEQSLERPYESWCSGRRANGRSPDLQTPFFGPGSVLVGSDNSGIWAVLAVVASLNETGQQRVCLERRIDSFPGLVAETAGETAQCRPRARQGTPETGRDQGQLPQAIRQKGQGPLS